MVDGKYINTDDARIREALEELIPLIDARLTKAAGKPMSFFLLAGVSGEQGVTVAANDDDPRDIVQAVVQWASIFERDVSDWLKSHRY